MIHFGTPTERGIAGVITLGLFRVALLLFARKPKRCPAPLPATFSVMQFIKNLCKSAEVPSLAHTSDKPKGLGFECKL